MTTPGLSQPCVQCGVSLQCLSTPAWVTHCSRELAIKAQHEPWQILQMQSPAHMTKLRTGTCPVCPSASAKPPICQCLAEKDQVPFGN